MSWMSRVALELVGQAGLGYSFGTLRGPEAGENAYAVAMKRLMYVPTSTLPCATCFVLRLTLPLLSLYPRSHPPIHKMQTCDVQLEPRPPVLALCCEVRHTSIAWVYSAPRPMEEPARGHRDCRYHGRVDHGDLPEEAGWLTSGRRCPYATGRRGKGYHECSLCVPPPIRYSIFCI
jgi:hypothetical protein